MALRKPQTVTDEGAQAASPAPRAPRQSPAWDRFLAAASEILFSSLDYQETLEAAARLAVPLLADWATIEVLENADLRLVAVAHQDPKKAQWAREMRLKYPSDLAAKEGPGKVIRTGKPALVEFVTEDQLRRGTQSEEHYQLIVNAGLRSLIMVPLLAGPKTVGMATFVRTSEGRTYSQTDVDRAMEFARRAGTAVERARLYAEVREARDQLQAIVGGIHDGITVQDPAGNIIYANDAAARLTGFKTAGEMVGERSDAILDRFELLDGQGRPFPPENLASRVALEGEASPNTYMQYRLRGTKDVKWSVSSAFPVKDATGRVKFAVNIFRDVTSERAAYETQSRLAAIVDSSEDAIVGKSLEDVILSWNKGAEHIFGYTAEEVVGKSIGILVPPELQSEEDRIVAATREGERVTNLDTKRRHKDGRIIDVSLSVAPIRDSEGHIIGASKIARDMTQQKAQQELEQLKEISRFRSQFLNMAAHELRTPLAPLRAELAVLESILSEKGDENKESLRVFRRNIERMARLVEDVLEGARYQSGQMGIRMGPTDMGRLVRETVESFRHEAKRQGVGLDATGMGAVPIKADEKRIDQVLYNLVSNAIKFTPPGGRVHIDVDAHAKEVTVRVQDTGLGIAPESASQLFLPFSQVHDTTRKAHPGTGLGLYICKGIVDLHGGKIWCESEGVGKGSTFAFTLPR